MKSLFRTTIRSFSTQARRARVVVVGGGRMGHIRSSILYANPRFDLVGVLDTNLDSAIALADTYQVRALHRLADPKVTCAHVYTKEQWNDGTC